MALEATGSGTAKSEFIIADKYRLMRKIGSGSFGDIYYAKSLNGEEVISFENFN